MEYVSGLDEDVAKLYHQADRIDLVTSDTSSEEFQIVAAILEVFEKRAEQREANRAE